MPSRTRQEETEPDLDAKPAAELVGKPCPAKLPANLLAGGRLHAERRIPQDSMRYCRIRAHYSFKLVPLKAAGSHVPRIIRHLVNSVGMNDYENNKESRVQTRHQCPVQQKTLSRHDSALREGDLCRKKQKKRTYPRGLDPEGILFRILFRILFVIFLFALEPPASALPPPPPPPPTTTPAFKLELDYIGRDARVQTKVAERVENGNERNTAIRDDEAFQVPVSDLLVKPVGRGGGLEGERERKREDRLLAIVMQDRGMHGIFAMPRSALLERCEYSNAEVLIPSNPLGYIPRVTKYPISFATTLVGARFHPCTSKDREGLFEAFSKRKFLLN
ncbi:hypothetical protein M0804_004015 [Polistes exclamans]|nr:hypothetical protein M0804_004015 [Polistes exclamans]